MSKEGQAKLKKYLEEDIEESMAGCTANIVLITQDEIYVANSGDSRSVLRTAKETIALSTDHKPELDSEYKRITDAGGYVEQGRINGNLNLSRAIGDLEYKRDKSRKPEE